MREYLKKRWSLIITLAFMAAMMFLASNAQAAEYWKARYEKFSAVAGETLATGDVVCILASDSYAYKADADSSTLRPAVGVIGKGGAAGATVEVITRGILAGQVAGSPGARLWLGTTAGSFSPDTSPGGTVAQALGWILPGADGTATSTTYMISVAISTGTNW